MPARSCFSYLLPFLIILYTPSGLLASSADTLRKTAVPDSNKVSFFYKNIEQFGTLEFHPIDTTLAGFENYDLLFKQSRFFGTLGNTGQDYHPLLPSPARMESGFDYGVHTFDRYLFQNDSIHYYKVIRDYSDLQYVQGGKKEINFRVDFSRNVYRTLNIGFVLRAMNSPGAYLRQKTNAINFVLTAQFFTKDKRYGFIANFLVNRLKNWENGGIQYDSLFEQNIEKNRQLIPVNLQTAQNRIKESGFYMKNYFNLTRHPKGKHDTTELNRHRFELGRLTYSFQYNRQIKNYMDGDPKSGFYPNIYLDSVETRDSAMVKKIINEITWNNPSFNPERRYRRLQLELGFRQQYIETSLHDIKHYFQQYIPFAGIYFNPFPTFLLEAHGDLVFGDYNSGDFQVRARATQILGKKERNIGSLSVFGQYSMQQPGWFFSFYTGNNFRWENTFQKQGLIMAGFSYNYKALEAGFQLNRIANYVYLDSAAQPAQFKPQFGYIQVYARGEQQIWRFTFKGYLSYQTIQGTTVLRLPAFMGDLSVYYTQPLFKNAALLQPGLSFRYNTKFYSDAYMPALRSFYLQDNQEVGDYLYMDVFINIKIQRARFFVMYSHFNASFMGRDYYMVPGYPMQDASFRFGISWRFHD